MTLLLCGRGRCRLTSSNLDRVKARTVTPMSFVNVMPEKT